MRPTVLVFSFNDALDPARAVDPSTYLVNDSQGRRVGISRVVYDPNSNSVAVFPDHLLNFHHPFMVKILGTGSQALEDTAGRALDGAGTGQPGSDYKTTVTWRNLFYPGNAPAWTQGVNSSSTASRNIGHLRRRSAGNASPQVDRAAGDSTPNSGVSTRTADLGVSSTVKRKTSGRE